MSADSTATAVVSGLRLPYEQQPRPEDSDDDMSSGSEDDSSDSLDGDTPETELQMRFREVVDIISGLYKLSAQIRSPALRCQSPHMLPVNSKDPDHDTDVLKRYAELDLAHTRELCRALRLPHAADVFADDFIIQRLAAATTSRRRQFMFWRNEQDLRPVWSIDEEPQNAGWSPKRIFETPDDEVPGSDVHLPRPPKHVEELEAFECPYCGIVCPPWYKGDGPWRAHLLQDLRPCFCTYESCPDIRQVFRSRREWSKHEASHRSVWTCPEHLDAGCTTTFDTKAQLQSHLREHHADTFSEARLHSVLELAQASTNEFRPFCPVCHASAAVLSDFETHLADHLAAFVSFALPRDVPTVDDQTDGGSCVPLRGDETPTSLPASSILSRDDLSERLDSPQPWLAAPAYDFESTQRAAFMERSAEAATTGAATDLRTQPSTNVSNASQQPHPSFSVSPTGQVDALMADIGPGLQAEALESVPNATQQQLGIWLSATYPLDASIAPTEHSAAEA